MYIGPGLTGALFSGCKKYRYSLWRRFQYDVRPERMVAFIGLNPSTADATKNDPTVTRCINYSKAWGYGGYVMLNLFAYRATDPREMKSQVDPVGIENDECISEVCRSVDKVILAWGNHGKHKDRELQVVSWFKRSCQEKAFCLSINSNGSPSHPLYLPSSLWPKPYFLG
jgi:hypothetical protein